MNPQSSLLLIKALLSLTALGICSLQAQVAPSTQVATQELSFASQPFTLYQVESATGPATTPDTRTWSPASADWLLGNGKALSFFQASQEGQSYRVNGTPLVNLNAELETLRVAAGVPALGALVIKNGQVYAVGAVGNRQAGVESPVTVFDKWSIGSVSKSVTATLAGKMVEEGLIGWETKLVDIFPEKAAAMAAGWSEVTLKMLLSNASGAPNDLIAAGIWNDIWNFEGMPRAARQYLIDRVTAQPTRFTPGTSYEYSNAGFTMAGAMLEQIANTPWETLIREKLFDPLNMAGATTGVPATPREINHTYGHSGTAPTALQVWLPARASDNPPAIGPSATVTANLPDMARYLQLHLQGARNATGLLMQPATFDFLHTRHFGTDYALGWNALNRPELGGEVLSHTGSNGLWFCNVWILPTNNWACVIFMNFGGVQAFEKSNDVVVHLMGNHRWDP